MFSRRGCISEREGQGWRRALPSTAVLAMAATATRAQPGICNETLWENANSNCPLDPTNLAGPGTVCQYRCAPGFGITTDTNRTPSLECTSSGWTQVAGSPSCQVCPAGKYQAGYGLACTSCEPGSEPTEDATSCTACNSSSASNGSRCVQCREWQTPNEGQSQCDACRWARDHHVRLCDSQHLSHCMNVAIPPECPAQARDHALPDGGPCAGYRCTPCPIGYYGAGYYQDVAHWDARGSLLGSPVRDLVNGSCADSELGCGCNDIDECSPAYSPSPEFATWPNRSVCHRFATCINFDGGRNCTCNTGRDEQLTVRQQGPITAGTLNLFPPCVPNGTAATDTCGKNQTSSVGFNACTNTSCKRLRGGKWTITDSMLRDGNLVQASKFSVASFTDQPGDSHFDWVKLVQELDPRSNYFPDSTPADYMPTGFHYVSWNNNGKCEDVNECIEVDTERHVNRPSQVCSKLYPRGLYPNPDFLDQLTKQQVSKLKHGLGTFCNSTRDQKLLDQWCCGSNSKCEQGSNLDSIIRCADA